VTGYLKSVQGNTNLLWSAI